MKPGQNDYYSFLLRLWRVKDDGEAWRASLQNVQSNELLGFPNLESLFQYLAKLTYEHRINEFTETGQARLEERSQL